MSQRFVDIEVQNDVIGWLVIGWDNIDKGERQLHVDYSDIVHFAADQYFEGDKSTAESWLKNVDWPTMKDEIKLLFIDKMSNDVASSKNSK